jgi:hypothetical protein
MKLFELLGVDPALAGDLLEERARGRSSVWYWRQVLVAACTGVVRTIFDHKLLALRALATGWAANAIWFALWTNFLTIEFTTVPRVSFEPIASLLLIFATQVATGWIIAKTHRAHAVPMVLVFTTWLTFWWIVGGMSEVVRLFVNSLDQPRFRLYLAWYLAPISLEVAGLLAGALLCTRQQAQANK